MSTMCVRDDDNTHCPIYLIRRPRKERYALRGTKRVEGPQAGKVKIHINATEVPQIEVAHRIHALNVGLVAVVELQIAWIEARQELSVVMIGPKPRAPVSTLP